jgi:primosomal protein N' (replication factor Y)
MKLFAEVILPLPLPKTYTYSIPEALQPGLVPGCRVEVQFGQRKKYAGIVKAIHTQGPEAYTTKDILSVIDAEPVVYPQQLRFWQWLAQYYMCSEGEVMNVALPAHLKGNSETTILYNPECESDFSELDDASFMVAEALTIRHELNLEEVRLITEKKNPHTILRRLVESGVAVITETLQDAYSPKLETFIHLAPEYTNEARLGELFNELSRAPKQLALLMAFIHLDKTEGIVSQKELLQKSGASAGHLKGLVDRQVLVAEKKAVDRVVAKMAGALKDFDLSPAQQKALDTVQQQFEQHQVVLLHGVTSSGKTQLYIRLIEECVASGKQVLYLLPEIALTAQIIRRLQVHFGDTIGIYHSKFSNNERVEIWNKVKDGKYRVVLGVRSALFLPFKELGLIIADEEHDSSYKQQDPAPRYHARDAAVFFGSVNKARVLLGSATPSLESWNNAREKKYGYAALTQRFGDVQMPAMQVVDMRHQYENKLHHGLFSSVLIGEIRNSLAIQKQVILFQNRRGYSPYLQCKTCGWIPRCKHCDVSLTYHKTGDKLHCHYCGTKTPIIHTCGACGSNQLTNKSFGTEKIEDELRHYFPTARIARMDVDSIRSKEGHNQLIHKLEKRQVDILVGTQMVVKGLDFEHVNLVGIMSADNILSFPDFRVNERGFQLMEQVAGRAGRKDGQGKVVIQALNAAHPVLEMVMAHNYTAMVQFELPHRKDFYYPPFYRLIKLTLRHKNENLVLRAAEELRKLLENTKGAALSGPTPPLVARVRNYFMQELLLKTSKDPQTLQQIKQHISDCILYLTAQKDFRQVSIVADVDPY